MTDKKLIIALVMAVVAVAVAAVSHMTSAIMPAETFSTLSQYLPFSRI